MRLITDYEQAVAYIDAHIGRGMSPGLDRISALLELMGEPQTAYPIIHVAGTNGKTSTARLATFLCVAHGLTTGTFTSPHLERIEQRFGINGQWLDADEFTQAVADVAAFADIYEQRSGESLTYFEITAAIALSHFADQAVDVSVVEVGLGGRLDATNVVKADVAVLTSVGLDHTEFLGDTIEAIAGEKLAILEPESTLVAGPLQPEVLRLATEVTASMAASMYLYGRDFGVEGAAPALGGWHVDIEGVHGSYPDIYLPVHGRFQTINLAVAIAAVEGLLGRALDPAAVIDGVAAFTSPGRMEVLESDPIVLLDGAHNRPAFEALAHSLGEEFPTTKWVMVFGAMPNAATVPKSGTMAMRAKRRSFVPAVICESFCARIANCACCMISQHFLTTASLTEIATMTSLLFHDMKSRRQEKYGYGRCPARDHQTR